MAGYKIHVFCDECAETHPMPITVKLDDGPAKKDSIGNTYKGKELPQDVANLINNKITCPNTKKEFLQRDNNQIFLVPIG